MAQSTMAQNILLDALEGATGGQDENPGATGATGAAMRSSGVSSGV